MNLHFKMLAVLQTGSFRARVEGYSLDLISCSTDTEDLRLEWWKRASEFFIPHHPVHRIFTPCAVEESGMQAMCNSPAKARVSPYKELTS